MFTNLPPVRIAGIVLSYSLCLDTIATARLHRLRGQYQRALLAVVAD
jgi:hypothetical protein